MVCVILFLFLSTGLHPRLSFCYCFLPSFLLFCGLYKYCLAFLYYPNYIHRRQLDPFCALLPFSFFYLGYYRFLLHALCFSVRLIVKIISSFLSYAIISPILFYVRSTFSNSLYIQFFSSPCLNM